MTLNNPSNAELNPICHVLALLGAHHILYFSRVKVKMPHYYKLYLRYSSTNIGLHINNLGIF